MVQSSLDAARVETLFRFAKQAYVAGVAAGGVLVLLLWPAVPAALLGTWFAALVAATVARLRVHAGYRRAGASAPALVWERRLALSTLVTGAVWAFVPAVLFPERNELLQTAVVVLIGAVTMAAAGLYAASARVVHAFVALPMAALVLVLATQGSATHRVLAVTMAIFTVVVLRVAREIRRSLVEALGARLEHEVLLDTLPVGVAFVRNREIVRCNHRLEAMLGYGPGELDGASTRDWFSSESRWAAADAAYDGMAEGGIMEGDARLRRKDGSSLWCRVLAHALDPAAPRESAIFTLTDVDRRIEAEKALRESEEKLRLAVEAAGLAYWEWDRESGVIKSNAEARPWEEYRDRVHPEDRERYLAAVDAAWKQGTAYSAEYRTVGRDGRVSWISARGRAFRDSAGRAKRMIGVVQDVTERRQQDETVRFLAHHDSLTGLPNRRLLDDRLKQALYRAQRRETSVGVLLIDLDDFKQVNDSAGHRAGDAVLREVAMRLSGCMRKADTLARHGGDEFVVVMGDLAGASDCAVVAEKIHRALAPEVHVDGKAFSLGASIGISVFPADAADAEALLRNADAAMYRAKQLGRNHYRFHGK